MNAVLLVRERATMLELLSRSSLSPDLWPMMADHLITWKFQPLSLDASDASDASETPLTFDAHFLDRLTEEARQRLFQAIRENDQVTLRELQSANAYLSEKQALPDGWACRTS